MDESMMTGLITPPSNHNSEEFKRWYADMKTHGYSDPCIAAISGESIKRLRKLTGQKKKKKK